MCRRAKWGICRTMNLNEQIALVELLSKRVIEDCIKIDAMESKWSARGTLGKYAMKAKITRLRQELLILAEKVGER